MSGAKVSDFMLQFMRRFVDEKKVAESTANHYINTLFTLNDKKPFKTLAFLRDTEAIKEKIDGYAPSTQKTLTAVIVSALDFYKTKAPYKKAYDYFSGLLKDKREEMEGSAGKMSDKQENNWVDWSDVLKKKTEMKASINGFISNKNLTAKQYDELLSYLILSLYTDIQPRRNQDYLDMFVVKKLGKDYDKTKNYYDIATQRFVFNKYKTAKKHGEQVEELPESLQSTLKLYLTHHPLAKSKAKEFKLLVKPDGSPLNTINSITRILNRIFGKKVGSSMLRHSYLSSKYGDVMKEMEDDAEAMGHTTGVQKSYIKN